MKLKKIYKIIPLFLTPIIALPVVGSLSSCSVKIEDNLKYIDFDLIEKNHQTSWYDLSKPKFSLNSLLYGNKNFNHGNYALMIGTIYSPNENGSLAKRLLFKNNSKSNFDLTGHEFYDSNLYRVWNYSKEAYLENEGDGVSFVSFLDLSENKNDTVLSPDAKWTADDEEENKDHKEGEYIRTDNGAKAYHKLLDIIDLLFKNFPDEDKYQDTKTSPYLIFWKDGIPKGTISTRTDSNLIEDEMDLIYKSDM